MGYPMTYKRVVGRNKLFGGYDAEPSDAYWNYTRGLLAGDLRRLETDQRDERHLEQYAQRTGLTTEDIRKVLDLFFEGDF